MNKFSKQIIIAFLLFLSPIVFNAQTGISNSVSSTCDNLVSSFMSTYNLPGLSIALAKDGKLVYMKGFADSNINGSEPVYPHHLFRIASISKPITSIAIMKLIEDGQLNLSDKVFNAGGLLSSHPYLSNAIIIDARYADITVQHLLEHSAGWNRNLNCFPNPTPPYPYNFNGCDPIVAPLHVTQQVGASNPVNEENMIYFLLEKVLDFTPGTQYQYSNIGYLVLGEIIEEITGVSYEEYVKTNILEPIGACDTHLARNLLVDKQEREMEYIGSGYTNLDIFGNGTYVPWEYGGNSVEAMTAHGGWISTARDLVRILLAIDKFSTKPDILAVSTINSMVAPSVNNPNYAKGWSVNSSNNWWHTGALDGTATFFCRTSGGFTWAVLINKRVTGTNANSFRNDLDNLPWNCIASVSSYPAYDLLACPTAAADNLVITPLGTNGCSINWQNGNGERRILVGKQSTEVDRFPIDGLSYTANSTFGTGSNLGNGNYVLYDGTANNFNVYGLDYTANYSFRVFEYNQNNNTGNYKLYNLSKSRSYFFDPNWYCPNVLNINSGPVPSSNYFADQLIHSNITINNGQNIDYYAGDCVNLNTGFEVKVGADFYAYNSGCDSYFGVSCANPRPITSEGVYHANGPDSGAGALQTDATNANWFVFYPSVSKRISISSCGEGVDTRVNVYNGSCGSLNLIASSDDACSIGASGSGFASRIQDLYVNAGSTYFIEWDDRWSTDGFDFEIR